MRIALNEFGKNVYQVWSQKVNKKKKYICIEVKKKVKMVPLHFYSLEQMDKRKLVVWYKITNN